MPVFEVVRGGSASALRVRLQHGEEIKAESDALVSKSSGVALAAGTDGGFLGGLARSFLTGESFFLQTLRCEAADGEALVAPEDQGDVTVIELGLPGAAALEVQVVRGAFLCADAAVAISTGMQGVSKGLFNGAGFFLMRCSGRGRLAVACLGSCVRYDLARGERRQVDNGHLVAWDAVMPHEVGMATRSIFGSVASGEGLMCTFTGPGALWVQTHKPRAEAQAGSSKGRRRAPSSPAGPFVGICAMLVFFLVVVAIFVAIAFAEEGQPTSRRRKASRSVRSYLDEF